MHKSPVFITLTGLVCLFLAVFGLMPSQVQSYNPTPIVVSLTPPGSSTPLPTPTRADGLVPDRFEPNDNPDAAIAITWGTIIDLTLIEDDVDMFTGFLKAGQWLQLETFVTGALDTHLILSWNGQIVAENDDRAATDLGSRVIFVAPAEGWYVATVSKVAAADGRYDLAASLIAPTTTPTPLPTLTSTPTVTPSPSPTPLVPPDIAEPNETTAAAWPLPLGVRQTFTLSPGDTDTFAFLSKAGQRYTCETITPLVDTQIFLFDSVTSDTPRIHNDDRGAGRLDSAFTWTVTEEQVVFLQVTARGHSYGAYDLICAFTTPTPVALSIPMVFPSVPPPTSSPLDITPTPTTSFSLTLQYLGPALTPTAAASSTHVHLLIYYDANNDRAPGPGEGVPDVSVLAVDAQGQRLARIFTNAEGEATFNLDGTDLERILVPFVPGWSARIRAGQINDNLVLGLPAVRLPIFVPVMNEGVSR